MRLRKARGRSANSRPAMRCAAFACAARRASISGVEPRAPRRERAMRRREAEQHRKILKRAEPVAQALRFRDPQLAELRPERLDQLHLIAMRDHAAAQVVQHLGVHAAPVLRRRVVARELVGLAELARELGELKPSSGQPSTAASAASSAMISRARAACVSCAASALSRFSSSRARIDAMRARRQRRLVLGEIGERFERRLRVARAGKFAPEVARLRRAGAARRRRERARAAAASRASASSPCGSRGPRSRPASPGRSAPRALRPGCRARRPGEPRRPQHLDARRVSRPCEGSMTPVCHNPRGEDGAAGAVGTGATCRKKPGDQANCLICRANLVAGAGFEPATFRL